MNAIIAALMLVCPMTIVINKTDRKWNKVDDAVLAQQHKTCQRMGFAYLEYMIRYDKLGFGIICGYARDCIEEKQDNE